MKMCNFIFINNNHSYIFKFTIKANNKLDYKKGEICRSKNDTNGSIKIIFFSKVRNLYRFTLPI